MRKIERIEAGGCAQSAPDGGVPVRLRAEGAIDRRLASPPAASIFLEVLELAPGSTVEWEPAKGDRALFVERGELAVDDGRAVPAGAAVVVESGARLRIEARSASRLLHMGPRHDGDPRRTSSPRGADMVDAPVEAGRRSPVPQVHLIGPRGRFEAIEPGRETRFFADATCATCSTWLLYTARSFAYESPLHSHSQDELIHVLRGEIAIGSLRAGPGTTLFIAADQPYRFRAGAEGFAFLNYREAGSVMTLRPSGERIVESGRATGMTAVAADGFRANTTKDEGMSESKTLKPLVARRVVVGPGPDGREGLLSDTARPPLGPGAMGDHAVDLTELWRYEDRLRSSLEGGDPEQDPWQMIPRAGGGALRLVRWRASSPGMHRTDTLDWLFILEGRIELEHAQGRVRLEVGDTVVIQDAVHCWHLIDGVPCTALAVMLRPAPGK